MDSGARKCMGRSSAPFFQAPPMLTSYITIVHDQNQETDVGTIYIELFWISSVTYALICMCTCVFVFMIVFRCVSACVCVYVCTHVRLCIVTDHRGAYIERGRRQRLSSWKPAEGCAFRDAGDSTQGLLCLSHS